MLRVHVKRIGGTLRAPAGQLLEVVAPRTNAALISPAEHLCAGLSLHTGASGGGPVALEIVGDGERCRFLVRAESAVQLRQLKGQVGAAYPQAALNSVDWASLATGDPAQALALHLLETCPLLPVDAFAQLIGLGSIGGAYKHLARLRQAGLVDVQRGDIGFLLCERPLGLWKITERGRQRSTLPARSDQVSTRARAACARRLGRSVLATRN